MANILPEQYDKVFSKPKDTYQYKHIKYNCDMMSDIIFDKETISKQIMKLNLKR